MKRLIPAGILTAIIILSLVFSIGYIDKVCQKTRELLDDCIISYDLNKSPKAKAQELSNYWSKKEPSLSFFANHERIDEIEAAIGSLKDYSDTENNEIFHEYCGTVKTLIHQLLEDTYPGVHSIF